MIDDRATTLLRRIAQALGVPASAFLDAGGSRPRSPAEVLDLLEAFAAVTDPERRRACIAFVQGARDGRGLTDEER